MDPISLGISALFIVILLAGLFAAQFQITKSKNTWVPHIKEKLIELSKLIEKSTFDQKKFALIEIDKLLDYSLKKSGAKGETMGERLKDSKKWFDKDLYNKIWEAHKARNNIVHEVKSTITEDSIKRHFKVLKRAIYTVIG